MYTLSTATLQLNPLHDALAFNFDLTGGSGATIQNTANGWKMNPIGSRALKFNSLNRQTGQRASFVVDSLDVRFARAGAAGLSVTSARISSWRLSDKAGNLLTTLTNNTPHPVVVINRTGQPMSLVSRAGSPARPLSLPPHSLTILNHVLYPLTVSGGRPGDSYQMSIPETTLPLTIIRSPQPQQNIMKSGDTETATSLN